MYLYDLFISASNNDSLPIQSGIFIYVSIILNGVNLILLQHDIPNVWDNNIDITCVGNLGIKSSCNYKGLFFLRRHKT